jgi:hypothetical protein
LWWKAVLLIIAGLAVVLVLAVFYAKSRWRSETQDMRDRLEAGRKPIQPRVFDAGELVGLPAPVERYFRTVLREGQPMIAAATVEHTGTFNVGEATDRWKPFTSTQWVVTQRPGFVWDGRVAMAPGVAVRVHDAYVGGIGVLHPAILGLVTLMDMRGTGDIAEGELLRFFAETAWYPTALLPSQGVRWEAVDAQSARGTLTDGATAVSLLFRFNAAGLISAVRAEARGRTVNGKVVPTPWEGQWSNYERHAGMQVPTQGEVAWHLPEGPKAYWRGRITRLEYEFTT